VAAGYGAAVEAFPWKAGDLDGEGNGVSPGNEALQDRCHAATPRMRPGGCAKSRDAHIVPIRLHCLGLGGAVKPLPPRLGGGVTG